MLDLNQFYGSSEFQRFSAFSNSIATEGIIHLCNEGNCSWLITDIDAHVTAGDKKTLLQSQEMLTVNIKRDGTSFDDGAYLRIEDGNGNMFVKIFYNHADLPQPSIDIWLVKNELGSFTYMLPSEY